jgi:hypothetical protein
VTKNGIVFAARLRRCLPGIDNNHGSLTSEVFIQQSDRQRELIELGRLDEEIRAAFQDFGVLMKEAEIKDWDAAIIAKADARMKEARELQKESIAHLEKLEAGLSEAERKRMETLEVRSMQPDARSRLWKRELTTKVMDPTTAVNIDDALASGLPKILAHIPVGWLHEQQKLRAKLGDDHLRRPLVLHGNSRVDDAAMPIHRFAYGLCEALRLTEDSFAYDIYEGCALLPEIAALCLQMDALKGVRGGIEKIRELIAAPNEEIRSRIFEMLVAAGCASLGRDVEFLKPGTKKTADMRIHDLRFPAILECKRQSSLSEYEKREVARVHEVFAVLSERRRELGLVGDLQLVFTEDIERVPSKEIVLAVEECVQHVGPYTGLAKPWGAVTFRPLEVSIQLEHETRLYSPFFLASVFGWTMEDTEFDGICATVENDQSMRIGRAELPFSLRWRIEKDSALERKARCVTSLLAEAVGQIPVGEGAFVYICYDDSHRAAVADRRTERIFELAQTFQVRRKWIRPPMLIVVGRLFPTPLGDGAPDLIESSVPMSTEKENVYDGLMPGKIFT